MSVFAWALVCWAAAGALRNGNPSDRANVRFARPNIQIYDTHVVDLYQWVCARYLVGVKGAETKAAGGESVSQSPLKYKAFSVFPDQNLLFEPRSEMGFRLRRKSSVSDIDTVTSSALSFTTLKPQGFSHVLPCSASGNVGKMPPYTISRS